jgi:hypothetical protein
MSDLSEKFTALEDQLAAQQVDTLASLAGIQATLDALNTLLDIMNENNAANTKALLAAIGSSAACNPCPTPSLVVPPIDTTPVTGTSDLCKRIQAFLHAMAEVFTAMDVMSAFSIPFSPGLIIDAIQEVITALENGDETPIISFPEAVRLVGDGINYIAGNFLVGDTLSDLFSGVVFDIQDAMFSSGDASAAQAAYASVISGSSIPSYAKPVMIDAAYNALFSYYFDPASTPNLTGYSGSACGEVEDTCQDLARVIAHSSVFGIDFGCIEFPTGWPRRTLYNRNSDTLSLPVVLVADLTGYSMIAVGGNITLQDQTGAGTVGVATTHNFTGAETEILLTCDSGTTCTFCGPDLPPPAR